MTSNNPSDVLASFLQPGEGQDAPRADAAEAFLSWPYQGHIDEQPAESHNENIVSRIAATIPPFLPGSNTHQILSSRPSTIGRALSPPNASVKIPQSVANLASHQVPHMSIPLLDADAVMDAAFAYNDYGGYGEMGGKRRKAPHERAGWKEMDMEAGPRKRGRRSANETATESAGAGYAAPGTVGAEGTTTGLEALTDLTKEQGEALARAFHEHESTSAQVGPEAETAPQPEIDDDGKGGRSRAEQNRRAQQVYRRKREERMKQLESAAAALEPLRKAYFDLVETTKDLLMSHEAKSIENVTLRATLLAAAKSGNAHFLQADNSFFTESTSRKGAPTQPAALENAFGELEKQARELAKQSRRERESGQAQ